MKEQMPEELDDEIYTSTSEEVTISVSPIFIEERSDIEKGIYAHSYHVTITNHRSDTIQLLNRHWKVISAGKQIADVKGEGVIGEQPVLEQDQFFEYESWTVVRDPIGSMFGTYTFVSENGTFFDVTIPEFPLLHIDDMTVH